MKTKNDGNTDKTLSLAEHNRRSIRKMLGGRVPHGVWIARYKQSERLRRTLER